MMHYHTTQVSSQLLRNFYANYFKTQTKYSIEHVIPQSYLKKIPKKGFQPVKDMHNLILYPIKLNIHRNNYKIVDQKELLKHPHFITYLDKYGVQLQRVPSYIEQYAMKDTFRKLFHPLDIHKGEIARVCAYMCITYPYLKAIMNSFVFDYKTLLEWNEQFPPNDYELERNDFVLFHQKNENIFITNHELVDDQIFRV